MIDWYFCYAVRIENVACSKNLRLKSMKSSSYTELT